MSRPPRRAAVPAVLRGLPRSSEGPHSRRATVIAKRSPEEVLQALTTGTMRMQAARPESSTSTVALATFVTGKAPAASNPAMAQKRTSAPRSRMEPRRHRRRHSGMAGAVDLDNSRFQPKPGLNAEDLPS